MLNERAAKDNDFFHQKLLRVQQDYEQQLYSFEAVSSENQQRQVELKVKEEEVVHLKQETAQISRQKERLQRKLHQIDEQKAEVERERDNLKGIIQGLDRGDRLLCAVYVRDNLLTVRFALFCCLL